MFITVESFDSKSVKFEEPNYSLLSFQFPAIFDREVSEEIVRIIKDSFDKEVYFIPLEILEQRFVIKKRRALSKTKDHDYMKYLREYSEAKYSKTSKEQDEQNTDDISEVIKKQNREVIFENIRIMVLSGYINYTHTFELIRGELKEAKCIYLIQKKSDMAYHGLAHSKSKVMKYILSKNDSIGFPIENAHFVSREELFKKIKDGKAELNKIINLLVKDDEIIEMDLIASDIKSEIIYRTYYFPGKKNFKVVRNSLEEKFVPALSLIFQTKSSELKKILIKENLNVSPEDLLGEDYGKIYSFCSLIIEQYKSGNKTFNFNDFNLAYIILSSWLHLHDDPISVLIKYPQINFDYEVLTPIFGKYISNFDQIQEYIRKIKGFLHHLPQVIEEEELINFFSSKQVKAKYIKAFLTHLPGTIKTTSVNKTNYYIDKSQIIPAIIYLFDKKYHKTTETGKLQFSILVKSFREIEVEAKTHPSILDELKAIPTEYDYVLNRILKGNEEYDKYIKEKEKQKEKTRDKLIRLSDKKQTPDTSDNQREKAKNDAINLIKSRLGDNRALISEEDLQLFTDEERESLFKAISFWVVNCVDTKENPYTFYIRRELLSFDDARFFRSKPNYEHILKRFNFV